MPSFSSLSVLALAAIAGTASAAFGPAFSTGQKGTFIREATSTLILPKGGNGGSVSLWVGMGTTKGDLIQSIADNTGRPQWSIFAYTLVLKGDGTQEPVAAPGEDANAEDRVTMHYKFDDRSQNYTQTVLVNGRQVSTLSTNSGHAEGWGSAVECQATDCGTIPEHKWIDTKITLDKPNRGYSGTLRKDRGVVGDMTTSDGGKTWVVSDIVIPTYMFGQ